MCNRNFMSTLKAAYCATRFLNKPDWLTALALPDFFFAYLVALLSSQFHFKSWVELQVQKMIKCISHLLCHTFPKQAWLLFCCSAWLLLCLPSSTVQEFSVSFQKWLGLLSWRIFLGTEIITILTLLKAAYCVTNFLNKPDCLLFAYFVTLIKSSQFCLKNG